MFLAPNFLAGAPREFLDLHYKIDTGSDHVVKFRGDPPRELGDYALKKKDKENITSKIEDLPYYRTGRSKKTLNYSIHSNKKHRQYESNKVNNSATKHSLCPGNGVFAHEKCIIFVILYVFLFLTITKTWH